MYEAARTRRPNTSVSPPAVRNRDGDLRPRQHRSSLKIRRRADFRAQKMLKYPGRGEFHCRAEFLHAALLEGDPGIEYYVPQPYALTVNGAHYIADIYFKKAGIAYVGELKPNGEFKDEIRIPLEQYFDFHRMKFIVIRNEDIFERETEARNWVSVVQRILTGQYLCTEQREWEIYNDLLLHGERQLGDYVDAGDRDESRANEVAVCKLLHAGKISADMSFGHAFRNFDLVLSPCV